MQYSHNDVFDVAAAFINATNHPVFLTGKAGTGKTTFLKYIREHALKSTVVVAPTGVAAINAGGVTIHSFFQLPFSPFLPQGPSGFGAALSGAVDRHSLLGKLRLSTQRKAVMQELELLIIDEISMVRADVLDAIDTVLRHVRNVHTKPFGGVQVLFIGDMYQLPPVVKDSEWQLLCEYYETPFFFSSLACKQAPPVYIELQKVYRQKDDAFISLLNKVRNNQMDEYGYHLLHSRLGADLQHSGQSIITLASHNYIADSINDTALDTLSLPLRSFKAEVEGEFYENAFPAEENLRLKEGAQVMFIKNDLGQFRKYFNGKIGTVKSFDGDKIFVECREDGGTQEIEVKKELWENITYSINRSTNQLEEEVIGTFKQYPLRLAWAITIHKSQGLTFDNVVIDAGKAFAPGQVYVALSRCTTLEGILLKSRINMQSLLSDERIVTFAGNQQSFEAQQKLLNSAAVLYKQEILQQIFDFKPLLKQLEAIRLFCAEHGLKDKSEDWYQRIATQFEQFEKHGDTFCLRLQQYFAETAIPEENLALIERLKSAASWFLQQLSLAKRDFVQCTIVTDNRQLALDFTKKMQVFYDTIRRKESLFEILKTEFSLNALQQAKRSFVPEAIAYNAYAGKSASVPKTVKHGSLYMQLRQLRDEICREAGLATYMVCGHEALEDLANYLPQTAAQLEKIKGFGKHKIKNYGNAFLALICAYCEENDVQTHIEELPLSRTRKKAEPKEPKPDTKLATLERFQAGKPIADIAAERNLAVSTVESHLAHFVGEGVLDVSLFVSPEKRSLIEGVIEANNIFLSGQLKALLPPDISFGEIKMVLATIKKERQLPDVQI